MDTLINPTAGYALQAEYDLMGCLLVAPKETLENVRGTLSASDFQSEDARAVFIAACQLENEKAPMDAVLIQARAAENGHEMDMQLLADVMKRFVTCANAQATAALIHEQSISREARNIGFALMQAELDPGTAVQRLQEAIAGQKSRLPTPMEDADSFMDTLTAVSEGKLKMFLSTGFPQLDELLSGGLIQNGVITLAARPGVGKTTMGLAIAENVAAAGGRVLYESLEMSRFQIWARRVGMVSGLSYANIQSGKLDEQGWERLVRAMQTLYTRNFFISAKPASMDDIERHLRSNGADLLVVDHMGLIKPEQGRDGRYDKATETSHRLKRLAQSTGVPILSLCQLNRASEARSDKRPSLADLRDTGAIEEDSDAVIILYRPAVHLPKDEQPMPWETQDLEVNVEKNRHGATGQIIMDFVGVCSRVRERPQKNRGYSKEQLPD